MFREVGRGAEFTCVDTDIQQLSMSSATTRILLGRGCSAAGKPNAARDPAVTERSRIGDALRGADVAFVVAGLGGGTGTGAAPVVAELARSMGKLR